MEVTIRPLASGHMLRRQSGVIGFMGHIPFFRGRKNKKQKQNMKTS
jgi:hypothetical protein